MSKTFKKKSYHNKTTKVKLNKSILKVNKTKKNTFTRKDYMNTFKDISSATASRDLKKGIDLQLFEGIGKLNKTKYVVNK